MIVKSALIVLGIVDFFWDGYEYISEFISRNKKEIALDRSVKLPNRLSSAS